MLIPTLIMGALAIVLLFVGYSKGQGQHLLGMNMTLKMLLQIMPLLICAFIVAGMVQVLLPKDLISRWVGAEAGMRGIWIGTVAGGLTPGGPYISLPVVAGLMRTGAGVGTLVAFLTAWSLWSVARLPMEIGLLGWRFTAIRLACTFVFPPIAGFLAHALFKSVALGSGAPHP